MTPPLTVTVAGTSVALPPVPTADPLVFGREPDARG